MYEMESISVFLDKAKFPGFRLRKTSASRTETVCHVIQKFSGTSPGKV